jgi:hypothetical protein
MLSKSDALASRGSALCPIYYVTGLEYENCEPLRNFRVYLDGTARNVYLLIALSASRYESEPVTKWDQQVRIALGHCLISHCPQLGSDRGLNNGARTDLL